VPGLSVVDSCELVPAVAPEFEFVIVQDPLLDGPTPRPSGPGVAGDMAVKVTATLPAVATENVKTREPFGTRAPLNVSVVVEVVGVPNRSLSGLLQADVMTDAEIRSHIKRRGDFILDLLGASSSAH
jgi:hypothetical protein